MATVTWGFFDFELTAADKRIYNPVYLQLFFKMQRDTAL